MKETYIGKNIDVVGRLDVANVPSLSDINDWKDRCKKALNHATIKHRSIVKLTLGASVIGFTALLMLFDIAPLFTFLVGFAMFALLLIIMDKCLFDAIGYLDAGSIVEIDMSSFEVPSDIQRSALKRTAETNADVNQYLISVGEQGRHLAQFEAVYLLRKYSFFDMTILEATNGNSVASGVSLA